MAVAIDYRAPKIRCYKCGSSGVRALCHHCWRPGCARHVTQSPAWAEQLFGVEGTGPGLKNFRSSHCADCMHVPTGIWLRTGASGLALLITGLLVIPIDLLIGMFSIFIGAVMALTVYIRIRHRSAQARANLPVALHPKVSGIRVFERLKTRITLDAHGVYRTQLDPVEGQLNAQLIFGDSDRDRLSAYVRKHRLTLGQKAAWSAGCLVPQGSVGIREIEKRRYVPVQGVDAAAILRLDREESPRSLRYNLPLNYALSAVLDIKAGPFWITPSITPGTEKHTLELDVQWTEFGPNDGDPLILDVIDLLRIRVPVGWGRIQEISRGSATVSSPQASDDDEWSRIIEWKQLSPDQAERHARQFTITIQFEDQIQLESDLSGHLEATMRGSLSGVSGMRMYNALGTLRAVSGTPSISTRVEADFTLSLASVRYQATRVFPDLEDEEVDRARFSLDFDVIPDDETVIALTNALAEEQFYIKRVTENPPRSGGRADVMNRYWHIAGRSYDGVHPVDFHVVVIGEELHRGDVRPESGNMKIRISVSGDYSNEEMCAQVSKTWDRLSEVASEAVMKARDSTVHRPMG